MEVLIYCLQSWLATGAWRSQHVTLLIGQRYGGMWRNAVALCMA